MISISEGPLVWWRMLLTVLSLLLVPGLINQLKKLPRKNQSDRFKLGDEVSLEYYRLQKIAEHNIELEDIYTGDGLRPRNISETALLTAILLPVNQNFKTIFKKLRLRESLEFTSLTTAVTTDNNNNLNIAISGVDPKVVVVKGIMDDDKGMFVRKALKGARAVDNDMFSRNYRRKMIEIYLNQSFAQLEKLESLLQ